MTEALPFEQLFRPLVLTARAELRERVDATSYDLLTPEAHAGWDRYLLTRLSFAGTKAAHWQFQVFKTVKAAFPSAASGQPGADNGLYCQFVGDCPTDRLRQLFAEFPVLASLCKTLAENWIAAVAEFLFRLKADYRGFADHLPVGQPLGRAVGLDAGLSDPHRGGRCVVRVRFENGAALVYKPRSIAPEAHFFALVEGLDTTKLPYRLKAAQGWNRGEYGWMENVVAAPCADPAEIHGFYWRSGALLSLVHLARGVDIHRENLIAEAAFPVLVDLEALWHPQEMLGNKPASITTSLLRTGFLPQRNAALGRVYEWSALCTDSEQERTAPGWLNPNQDDMSFVLKKRMRLHRDHLPACEGGRYAAKNFVDDVQAGFRWMSGQLLQRNGNRSRFVRWLRALVLCPRRRIVRSSAVYQAVQAQLTSPAFLRTPPSAETLLTKFAPGRESEHEAEVHALRQLDIPYFNQVIGTGATETDPADLLPSEELCLKQVGVIAESLQDRL